MPGKLLASGFALAVLVLAHPLDSIRGEEPGYLGKPVSQWMSDLNHTNLRIRRSAAFALGKTGPAAARAVPHLVRALQDPEASVREAAAFSLGELGPSVAPGAFPNLLEVLTEDRNPQVRRSAAFALGSFGPKAIAAADPLQACLRDKDPGVRQNAAWALGRLGPRIGKTAIAKLIEGLEDKDSLVRRDVAGALGEIGHDARAAIAPLLARFRQDVDVVVRKAALNALVNLVGPEDRPLAADLAKILGDPDAENVRAAALALGNIGGQEATAAVPALREAVKDEDAMTRRLATAALANIGSPAAAAVPDLRKALSDSDPLIRRNAALALGRIGPKAGTAVFELIRALDPKEADEVRRYAAEALWHIGPPATEQAAPALIRIVKEDRVPVVRIKAMVALATLDLEKVQAVPVMEAVLAETNPPALLVRYNAALLLGLNLGERAPEKVLDVLLEILKDKSTQAYTGSEARLTSASAEAKGGQTKIKENLTGDGRWMAAQALGHIGAKANRPEIVRLLEEAAQAPDAKVREEAKKALKNIKKD